MAGTVNIAVARPLTDAGNAEFFRDEYGDLVRYDHARRHWLVWDLHRWKPDADATVSRMALGSVRMRQLDALNDPTLSSEERSRAVKWLLSAENRSRLDSLLAVAKTLTPIADDGLGWDSTPWLLGVPNGVVDLRTGELRAGRPDDRITMQVAVEYDPKADCPRFKQFVRETTTHPDSTPEQIEEMARFMNVLLGYTITGSPSQHIVPFLMGVGSNGKSTMVGAIANVLGDYACGVEATVFKASKSERHSTEIAHLEQSRFAYCEELGDSTLNADRLKYLTGSKGQVTGRGVFQDSRDFSATWVIWLTTNGLPSTNDNSWAFWRRVIAVDFPRAFPKDGGAALDAELAAEAKGVLTWLVWGAVRYHRAGESLGEYPTSVVDATAEYREQMDPLESLFESGVFVADPDAVTPTAALYEAYVQHGPPGLKWSDKVFGKHMRHRHPKHVRPWVDGKKTRCVCGVRVGAVAT